jgi:DNA-directed RNA polymerase specialized sigma24 family protein
MQSKGLHEILARDRRRYERLLLSRMGSAISPEDAEDIVSDALIRVQLKASADPPRGGHEEGWFARIVLNLGIDFLRARDGRRRNGSSPRPAIVPLSALEHEPAAEPPDEDLAGP